MAVLPTEAAAYEFLERLRWGDGAPAECPACGAAGRAYYLQPNDDRGRRTRTGARTARRVWKCGACRRQFSVLTGTILQGTRISLLTWIAVIGQLIEVPQLSPRELADRFGVTPETARHMVDRLARAAGADPLLADLRPH